jgi:hypothetical protein
MYFRTDCLGANLEEVTRGSHSGHYFPSRANQKWHTRIKDSPFLIIQLNAKLDDDGELPTSIFIISYRGSPPTPAFQHSLAWPGSHLTRLPALD